MKKIFLLLLLIPNIVFANESYTEYKEFIKGSSEYIEESDTLKREEYKVYNTYKEIIEEYYLPLNEESIEYEIDYNDYIYHQKISDQKNKNEASYQTKCFDNNLEIKNIHLSNFVNRLKISEIEINTKNDTDYMLNITHQIGKKEYLQDKDLYENYLETGSKTNIEIIFFDKINLSDLEIKLYVPKQKITETTFEMIINKWIDEISYMVSIKLDEENNLITITFDKEYETFLKENEFYTTSPCFSYYTEEIILYKHKKITLEPTNIFLPLNNSNNFILSDYKVKYNYYKREKIELKDSIVLKNNLFNTKDYLISSTIPINELTIIDNIDYSKSGTYLLEIYFNNKLLIKNTINYEYEALIVENKKEKTTDLLNENVVKNKKTYTTKKITKHNLNNKTNIKKQHATTTKTTINRLSNIIYKSTKKNNKKFLIIIILCLIIALTIFEIILLYVKIKYY